MGGGYEGLSPLSGTKTEISSNVKNKTKYKHGSVTATFAIIVFAIFSLAINAFAVI